MFEVNKNPTTADLRKFGATMLIGFGVIGGLLWWLRAPDDPGHTISTWRGVAIGLWCLGLGIGVLSLTFPPATRVIYIVWMTFATILGRFMTRVLFTVFFFVLLPVFALIRLNDPLRKRMQGESYWEKHGDDDATIERASRMF